MTFRTERKVRRAPARISAVVCPADVQTTSMDLTSSLLSSVGVQTFGAFLREMFLPDLNRLAVASHAQVYDAPRSAGTRSIYFALTTSALLASAPAAAQTLAAQLVPDRAAAYVLHSTTRGDVWIIGQGTEALRHGAYEFLQSCGIIYAYPHEAGKMIPTVNEADVPTKSVLRTPAWRKLSFAGEGGLGQVNQPPLPHDPTRLSVFRRWEDWIRATRSPQEFLGGHADGTEQFTQYYQTHLGADRTMLAWTPAPTSKRGYSESGDWPTVCFHSHTTLAKTCFTHNGGAGSYPAAPASDPWVGVSVPPVACTLGAANPQAPLPDTETYPHDANNYSAFGGLVQLQSEHLRNVVCARMDANHPMYPSARAVSAEPHDGSYKCYCTQCVALLRRGPYGAEMLLQDVGIKSSGTSPPAVTGAGLLTGATNFRVEIQSSSTFRVSLDGGSTWLASGVTIPVGSTYAVPGTLVTLAFPAGSYSSDNVYTLADASDGDKVFHLGLQNQLFLRHWFQNAPEFEPHVGLASYQTHSTPPHIPIDPKMLVAVVDTSGPTYLGAYDTDEFADIWAAKKQSNTRGPFLLGLSVFELTDSENWGQPGWPNPLQSARKYKRCHDIGYDFFSAQTGNSALNIGPHFYIHGKQAWEPEADPEALLDEWFSILGPAAPAIRNMCDRWWQAWHYSPHEYAVSFRDLQTAQDALDAAPDSEFIDGRAKAQTRLNHFKEWVEFLRRGGNVREGIHAFLQDPSIANQGLLGTALDEMHEWCWKMDESHAAHGDQSAQALKLRQKMIYRGGVGSPNYNFAPTIAWSGTADADATIIRIEVTTAGALGAAQLRWSKDGGSTWTSGVTITASMSIAGCTFTFPSQNYLTTFAWAFYIGLYRKWDESDPSAPANWSSITSPTTAELNALVTSRIASLTPVAGVTRLVHSENYSRLTVSADTTYANGPLFTSAHHTAYLMYFDGSATPVQVRIVSGGVGPDKPLRVRLMSFDGTELQVDELARAGDVGGTTVTHTITYTRPAGWYRVFVQCPRCSDSVRIQVQRRTPCVWYHDPPDRRLYTTNVFNDTYKAHFYVPPGLSKILLAYKTILPVQFFDDTGASVTTTKLSPFTWSADVAAGRDGKVWSFTGLRGLDNLSVTQFENCPNLISFHPDQMIVPAELLP